ncbi:hypothetical protein [Glycomyces harbinensis]|uniref:Uncharacterized protein n=1 Tax=Glycomyces harbinensis TaxID=58114 RepID=A0A1G6R337_9ACTN|nr:hypothetical protein [Glycomyces harbinensis]SDC98437.1 hypothetical protein SAMN05216270_101240 [Glycomyces harbinensis]
MIPQLVTVRYRLRDGRFRRWWIPVVPVVLLLSPLLLLAVVGGVIACLIFKISPLGALAGVGRVMWAMPGARFEIVEGRTAFLVSVR